MIRLIGLFLILLITRTGTAQSLKISIDQLGATGSKLQDVTSLIQQAIDSCYKAGGGTVILPRGNYTSATIYLKSGVSLRLKADAKLFASTDPKAYPNISTIDKPVLIYAEGAEHISIGGQGQIVGQPAYVMKPYDPSSMTERAYRIAVKNGLQPMAPVRKAPSVSLVTFSNCRNVSVSGITLLNSPFWGLHIRWSQDVSISRIHIYSNLEMGVNSDGIDIDGSKDVTISNCIISTADDAIALKTTRYNGQHKPCKNITVKRCLLTSTSSALKIGTESYDNFSHISFVNNTIRNTNRGLAILIRDGGTAKDITFSHISVETNRKDVHWWGNGELLTFAILKRNWLSKVGRIQDVTIKNVTARVQGTSRISGFHDRKLHNIRIENVTMKINPEKRPDKRTTDGFQFYKVKHLTLNDVTVRWNKKDYQKTWQSGFSFKDIEELRVDNLSTGSAFVKNRYPAVDIDGVNEASFDSTHALPKTNIFFEIGEDSENLTFTNNKLKLAETNYKLGNKAPTNIQIEEK